MKISFMTFACPEWRADQVISAAASHRYDGIEWRISAGHKHGVEVDLSAGDRRSLARRVADAGLQSCCLASSLRFNFAKDAERREMIDSARPILELAADLNASGVRVFGGSCPEGHSLEEGVKWASDCIAQIAPTAAELGVQLWLETHDAFCAARSVAAVLANVNHPNLRANWDVMHPYRGANEPLDVTRQALSGKIAHTHFHDCKAAGEGGGGICPFGQGYLPIQKMLKILHEERFEGYLSGEWFANDLGDTPDRALATYISGCKAALAEAGLA